MSDVHPIAQKVKGKLQKAKGNLQQNLSGRDDVGTKVKGGVSKIKGSLNESIADLRLSSKRHGL